MLRLAFAFLLGLCVSAHAQLSGGVGGFPGPGTVHSAGGAYAGPGDVVASARMWGGLRAYSLATVNTASANICNAADANCADVNSLTNGDFDVATATGAPLNCGGAGGTCTVKILYDKSGTNACTGSVPCNWTNTTIANRPTLTFNCIGAKPCMTFNGTSQSLQPVVNVITMSQPFTYSAAAQSTNTATSRSILATNGGSATQLGYPTTNNTINCYAGSSVSATASAASYHALQCVINNASSDMNVDGTQTTGTTGAQTHTGQVLIGQIGASQWMSGQLLEVGAWPIAFNSTQSSNMSSNQHSYWGF